MRYSIEQCILKIRNNNKLVSNFSAYSDELKFKDLKEEYCFEVSDVKSDISEDINLFRNSILKRYLRRRSSKKYINLTEKSEFAVDKKLIKMANVAILFEIIIFITFLVLFINDVGFQIVNLVLFSFVVYLELRTRKVLKYIKIS